MISTPPREERIERGGPLGRGGDVANPELEGLEAVLGEMLLLQPGQQQQQPEAVAAGGVQARQAPEAGGSGRGHQQQQQQDPFLLYLYGEVLAARGRGQEALEALTLSLRAYPCNWSAWQVRGGGGAKGEREREEVGLACGMKGGESGDTEMGVPCHVCL